MLHPADPSGSGRSAASRYRSQTTVASMARMITFRLTNATARLLPATFETPNERRIHAGPYTEAWAFQRIHGNHGSAQKVLGLTTKGLAWCTACIRP